MSVQNEYGVVTPSRLEVWDKWNSIDFYPENGYF